MKKYNKVELLTGYIMGLFIGTFVEADVILLYNILCRWRGCSLLIAEWWMLIPFPLIFAIFMARAIAGLHLEDY